jgi:hypothetical protein
MAHFRMERRVHFSAALAACQTSGECLMLLRKRADDL